MFLAGQGRHRVSSRGLADIVGVNSWQVRKDFSYFGGFGTRGVGYDIEKLVKEIKRILKLDVVHKVALVGVGNLGRAILAYPGFKRDGFEIAVAFDIAPQKIGTRINEIVIEDVTEIRTLKERNIDIAMIAVPRDAAQKTADDLVEAGAKGILNFAPCYITVPKNLKAITIDIAVDLARLPYYMPPG